MFDFSNVVQSNNYHAQLSLSNKFPLNTRVHQKIHQVSTLSWNHVVWDHVFY